VGVGINVPCYSSAELDTLIDRVIVTVPVPERNEVIGRILNHRSGNLIGMGIFYSADAVRQQPDHYRGRQCAAR
jgi:hypothetical protein